MEIKEKINELERQLNELKASLKEEAKEERPITERVKTFEDALDVLGEDHLFVEQWWDCVNILENTGRFNADLYAYLKLRIITAALNEGWKPNFTKDEYRYYPWFALYTQKEWDELTEEQKEGGVLFDGYANYGAHAGFIYACSTNAPSIADAHISSRLCYKTAELAEYSARQFTDIWADFYLIRK